MKLKKHIEQTERESKMFLSIKKLKKGKDNLKATTLQNKHQNVSINLDEFSLKRPVETHR